MSNRTLEGKKGFTLIELLIVIGVLGILAGIILVAVDPAKRLRQARDARRFSEVNSLLNAILNYTVDNKGILPGDLANATTTSPSSPYGYIIGTSTNTCDIGCSDSGNPTWEACIDFNDDLVDEYIAELPIDPLGTHATDTSVVFDAARTGYYVTRSANGRVEVGSCNAEIESSIKIKR